MLLLLLTSPAPPAASPLSCLCRSLVRALNGWKSYLARRRLLRATLTRLLGGRRLALLHAATRRWVSALAHADATRKCLRRLLRRLGAKRLGRAWQTWVRQSMWTRGPSTPLQHGPSTPLQAAASSGLSEEERGRRIERLRASVLGHWRSGLLWSTFHTWAKNATQRRQVRLQHAMTLGQIRDDDRDLTERGGLTRDLWCGWQSRVSVCRLLTRRARANLDVAYRQWATATQESAAQQVRFDH